MPLGIHTASENFIAILSCNTASKFGEAAPSRNHWGLHCYKYLSSQWIMTNVQHCSTNHLQGFNSFFLFTFYFSCLCMNVTFQSAVPRTIIANISMKSSSCSSITISRNFSFAKSIETFNTHFRNIFPFLVETPFSRSWFITCQSSKASSSHFFITCVCATRTASRLNYNVSP